MAIEKIPKINATASAGGVVYSIEFQRTFSTEASKVTYRVVNSTGVYTLPTLGANASISFGSFSFSGYIYSYELEESLSGNVLSITLIDKSVILDKYYVCVFRRGILGVAGTKKNVSVDVKFSDDEGYYVLKNLKLVKKKYTDGKGQVEVSGANSSNGNILVVGSEEAGGGGCDISASSYTFKDLKSTVKVSGFSSCPISDDKVRKTYEGTLRSVLISWCQDFGYSFYWDYSANTLKFINLNSAVSSLPNVTAPKIVSKKTYKSVEGMYNQVCVDYFSRPFNPKNEQASKSVTSYTTYALSPYSIGNFIDKQLTGEAASTGGGVPGGVGASASDSNSSWGSKRSRSEFIVSAALGYVSPTLRKIWNYSFANKWGTAIGLGSTRFLAMNQVAVALNKAKCSEVVADMVAYSGSSIGNLDTYYYACLAKYDEGLEEMWTNLEQDIFTNKIGNYYRCGHNRASSFTFCSPNLITRSSISYEPEGDTLEDADAPSTSLAGLKVFTRGAPGPSIGSSEAADKLGIDDTALQKLIPYQKELQAGSKLEKEFKLMSLGFDTTAYDTLLIFPNRALVDKKIKFSATYMTGSNKKETLYSDVDTGDEPEPCKLENLNEDKCMSIKEKLMKKQRDADPDAKEGEKNKKPVSGLMSRAGAVGVNIMLGSKSVNVLSSSQGGYQGCATSDFSVEAQLDTSEKSQFTSNLSGSTSSSQNIIETRLIVENRTTADNLREENLSPADLKSRTGYVQAKPLEKVVYSCAGFVSALPMGPESGLDSIDMSISDAGFTATYSYSTRPASFPRQDLSRVGNGSDSSAPAIQVR
jgi:hypothetical protein